jgi:hypothetical protein
MTDWTWESPQTWVALTAAVLGPLAWVVVTWAKSLCRHEYKPWGEVRKVEDGWGNRYFMQPCHCSKCGKITRYRV